MTPIVPPTGLFDHRPLRFHKGIALPQKHSLAHAGYADVRRFFINST